VQIRKCGHSEGQLAEVARIKYRPSSRSDVKSEIGHVLFTDIVGYTKLLAEARWL
jgi:hypothetical protein